MGRTTNLVLGMFFLTMAVIPFYVNSQGSDVEWVDKVTFTGSCATENIRRHIQVNRTVVEIIVTLSWEVNGTGANLDMWLEHAEGYVVNASDSLMMPEVMRVRDFPNRGKWTLVIVSTSCGTSGEAFYTANITLRNIALPVFAVSKDSIAAESNVTMTLSSGYENVSEYFFRFGDGTDSGWIEESSVTKEYLKKGEYSPRGKVRYSDGTESDWIESGIIEVAAKESGSQDVSLAVQVVLAFIVFLTGLALILIKRRKGV